MMERIIIVAKFNKFLNTSIHPKKKPQEECNFFGYQCVKRSNNDEIQCSREVLRKQYQVHLSFLNKFFKRRRNNLYGIKLA